jgi:hypothetical protein
VEENKERKKYKNNGGLGADGSRESVILATQEAEIRRITVQSQPGLIVCETPSLTPPKKPLHTKGLVVWLKV